MGDESCAAIDFYTAGGWCNTFSKGCTTPLKEINGASSYLLQRNDTVPHVTMGHAWWHQGAFKAVDGVAAGASWDESSCTARPGATRHVDLFSHRFLFSLRYM